MKGRPDLSWFAPNHGGDILVLSHREESRAGSRRNALELWRAQ